MCEPPCNAIDPSGDVHRVDANPHRTRGDERGREGTRGGERGREGMRGDERGREDATRGDESLSSGGQLVWRCGGVEWDGTHIRHLHHRSRLGMNGPLSIGWDGERRW